MDLSSSSSHHHGHLALCEPVGQHTEVAIQLLSLEPNLERRSQATLEARRVVCRHECLDHARVTRAREAPYPLARDELAPLAGLERWCATSQRVKMLLLLVRSIEMRLSISISEVCL
jgi:hypothetical protein